MEDNNLENKLMKDLKDNLKDINENISSALSGIDVKLKKELGDKGYARWIAYNTKFAKLMRDGKEKEAKELEKTFLSGQ